MVFISFDIIANVSSIVKVKLHFFTTFFDDLFLVFFEPLYTQDNRINLHPFHTALCISHKEIYGQLLLFFSVFRICSLTAQFIRGKSFSQDSRFKGSYIWNTKTL